MSDTKELNWLDTMRPHIGKFEVAAAVGGEASWNAEGSQAMATLLRKMCGIIDTEIGQDEMFIGTMSLDEAFRVDADGAIWSRKTGENVSERLKNMSKNNGKLMLIESPTPSASSMGEPHPDDLAVDRFAATMKAKLAKKREEGRGGWEDKEQCSNAFLSRLLVEHVQKGDPVDIGNLAMMIHQRGEGVGVAAGNASAIAQLNAIVDAWEALPGGRHVRNSDVESWLGEHMGPGIDAIRGFLRRPRPDGVLPLPPATKKMLWEQDAENAAAGAMAVQQMLEGVQAAKASPSSIVSGWQPIATAPTTGEEIIGRTGPEWGGFSCRWNGEVFIHVDSDDGYVSYSPTEWMPMPAPSPQTSSGGLIASQLCTLSGLFRLESGDRFSVSVKAANEIVKLGFLAASAIEATEKDSPVSSSGGRIAELEAERNLFKGKYRSIIALMDDTRQKVQVVVDHIQDEGDRAYLGSTNHADTLRDLVDDMDSWSFDAMLPKGDINKMERDPYAEIREQRTRANRALAALKDAVGHIEHMAEFITSQQAGYSFESLGEDMPGIKDALSATVPEGE